MLLTASAIEIKDECIEIAAIEESRRIRRWEIGGNLNGYMVGDKIIKNEIIGDGNGEVVMKWRRRRRRRKRGREKFLGEGK